MTNEELSDTELFDQAVTETEEEQVQQQEEQTETQETETEQRESAETTQTERQQVDDNAPHVPSWRLREINEEKRTLAEKVAALEAEKLQWQRQQPAPQEQKAAEKPAKPDPLIDPEGYERYLEQKFEEKQLAISRENSLKLAARTYKDEFKEAYAAAQKQVDPVLKARMQQSDDPGETLIQWHRENKQRAEIGDDLSAYNQRVLDKALSDPAFLAKALEKAQGAARQAPQTNGRPRVELPPSMSSATRANATARSTETGNVSDRDLWNEIAG